MKSLPQSPAPGPDFGPGVAMHNSLRMQFRFYSGMSREIRHTRGVIQGSANGPILAAIYFDQIIRYLNYYEKKNGAKLGDLRIVLRAYADDLILLADR